MKLPLTILILALAGPAYAQSIAWSGPRLTPAQAADVLRPNQYRPAPACDRCDGPYFASTGAGPSLGPA